MFINQDTSITDKTITDTNLIATTIEDNNIIYFAIGMFVAIIIIAVLLIRYYTRNPTEQVKTQKYRRQSSQTSHTFKGFEIIDNQIKSTDIKIKVTESKTNDTIDKKQLIMQQDQHASAVDLSQIPMGKLTNTEIVNLIKSNDSEIINLIKKNKFYSNLFMICENQIHQIGEYTKPSKQYPCTIDINGVNIEVSTTKLLISQSNRSFQYEIDTSDILKLITETTNNPTKYFNLQSTIKDKLKIIGDDIETQAKTLRDEYQKLQKSKYTTINSLIQKGQFASSTIAQYISKINSILSMIKQVLSEECKSSDAHIEDLSDLFTSINYKTDDIDIQYYALKDTELHKNPRSFAGSTDSLIQDQINIFHRLTRHILIIDGFAIQNENIIKDITQFTINKDACIYGYKTLFKMTTSEFPTIALKSTDPTHSNKYNLSIFIHILNKIQYNSWSEGDCNNILQAAKIIIIGLINGNLLDVYTKIENEIKLVFDAFEAHQKDQSIPYKGYQGMPLWNHIASYIENLLDNQNIESLQNSFNNIPHTTLNELKSKINPKYIGLTTDRMLEILKSPKLSKEYNL